MGDADQLARARAYIELHQQTYTEQALRRKLLDEGFDPQIVDRALAEIAAERRAVPISPRRTAGVVGLAAAGTTLVDSAACIGALNQGFGLTPILIGVALQIAAIVALWSGRRPIAQGMLIGMVVWMLGTILLILLVASQL